MDKWTQLTRQPEYLHLVLNHLPIVGLATALVFLLGAMLLRHRPSILLALGLSGLLAASTIAVLQSGEAAYNRVRGTAPHDPLADVFLRAHADAAERYERVFYATTALILVVAVAGAFAAPILKWGAPVAFAAGAVGVVCAAFVAESGGQIKHRELRVHGPPPGQADRP